MSRADPAVRFVRALLPHAEARLDACNRFAVTRNGRTERLGGEGVARLMADGVLAGDHEHCRAGPEARSWLRRALAEAEPFAAQHRQTVPAGDGARLNLAESPLARLASGGSAAFLAPHQLEAGERIRRLTERAQLQPRLTMRYTAEASAGGSPGKAAEISDFAADARRRLNACLSALPADCAGVVFDVCGLLKGLQQVEAERGWPRRSGKLVLRIGLEQVAMFFGLGAAAIGSEGRRRAWLDTGAKPTRFE
jgi:hypothetical protein